MPQPIKKPDGLSKLQNFLENFKEPTVNRFQGTSEMIDKMFEIVRGNLPSHQESKHFEISNVKESEDIPKSSFNPEDAEKLQARLDGSLQTKIFSIAEENSQPKTSFEETKLIDTVAASKQISKFLREDLRNRLTQTLTVRDIEGTSPYDIEGPLDLLQELALAKYNAEVELTRIQGKKDKEISTIEQNLQEAEKIILKRKLEFFAQMLVDFTKHKDMTEEVKTLTPSDLQNYRSAQHQLKCALRELKKSMETGIKPTWNLIDQALERAENLYPSYKTNDRFQLMKSRLCEILV